MTNEEFSYFNEMPPEEWSFVGFYEYRERQPDFKKSFSLEAFKLQKALDQEKSCMQKNCLTVQR